MNILTREKLTIENNNKGNKDTSLKNDNMHNALWNFTVTRMSKCEIYIYISITYCFVDCTICTATLHRCILLVMQLNAFL